MAHNKLCQCGSGEIRRELKDAKGIFCAFVCNKCEKRKKDGFNPAIFDGRRYDKEIEEPIEPDD